MIGYLKRRLEERATWAAIGASIPAAALLPGYWPFAVVGLAVLAVLAPSPGRKGGE